MEKTKNPKKEMGRISIITVCYNAKNLIEKTILSVINQTYKDIEYIIIDGGSNDGTLKILETYSDRITKILSEPDKGIYDAMNKGIRLATGDWIQFLNAGDCLYSNVILSKVFDHDVNADILYGDVKVKNTFGSYVLEAQPLETLSQGEINFCHQSSFVNTKVMKETFFDLKYRICADYHFFYNAWKNGKVFCYIPLIVSEYDVSEGSYAASHVIQATKEKYRIIGMGKKETNIKMAKLYIKFSLKKIMEFIMPHSYLENRIKRKLESYKYVKSKSW